MDYYEDFHNHDKEEDRREQKQNPISKDGNSMANTSLACGIFALLSNFVFLAPSTPMFAPAIFLGVAAVTASILSRNRTTQRSAAITGMVLGILAIILGLLTYLSMIYLVNMVKDPEYAPLFNSLLNQFQQMGLQVN